jgi:hypothetical protein
MSEKQTTFFTINCAENLESPNQCVLLETTVKFQSPGWKRRAGYCDYASTS